MSNELALRAGIFLVLVAAVLFWLASLPSTPPTRRTSEWQVSNHAPTAEYVPHRPTLMPRSFYGPAAKGVNGRRRA